MRKGVWAASLLMATLSSASFAANVKVTTTSDENNNNNECSLREAVAFLNGELKDTNSDCYVKDENQDPTIELKAESEYVLNSELNITASMVIKSDKTRDFNNISGEKLAVIKNPKGRVFVVDNGSSFAKATTLRLNGLALIGAFENKQAISSSDINIIEGGLIYNRETLNLERVRLIGGGAYKGGAIYNASLDASMNLSEVEFSNNFADEGAALFSERSVYTIKRSLFKHNKQISTNNNGFALQTIRGKEISEVPTLTTTDNATYKLAPSSTITNSIFFENATGAFNLVAGIQANNNTVINNLRGIAASSFLDAPNPSNRPIIAAGLANTVVLNNTEYDINLASFDSTFVNHSVMGANKLIGILKTAYQEQVTLLAADKTKDLVALEQKTIDGKTENICRAPAIGETTGLFCPLIQLKDEFLATVKPRLLMSYNTLADSPIVNKGATQTSKQNINALTCEAKDIRDQKRTICDIGAFELVIDVKENATRKAVNDEIKYGETATLNLKDAVGDGQLLPANLCSQYIKNPPTDKALWPKAKVGDWSDGCLLYVQGGEPKKGKLTVNDSKDKLIYTPDTQYHGFDAFDYRIITTTSRFSESENNQLIRVKSIVRQSPVDNFKSKTINLGYSGGGSMHWFILVLLGLFMGVRTHNKP